MQVQVAFKHDGEDDWEVRLGGCEAASAKKSWNMAMAAGTPPMAVSPVQVNWNDVNSMDAANDAQMCSVEHSRQCHMDLPRHECIGNVDDDAMCKSCPLGFMNGHAVSKRQGECRPFVTAALMPAFFRGGPCDR